MHPTHPHKLAHNPFTSRWSCRCGYTLGDGREAFLAPCRLSMAKERKTTNKRKSTTRKAKR
jgi:hypothetical protein